MLAEESWAIPSSSSGDTTGAPAEIIGLMGPVLGEVSSWEFPLSPKIPWRGRLAL